MTIERTVLDAIRVIVDYDWDAERDDYEKRNEDGDETAGHVFEHLQTVDAWLRAYEMAEGGRRCVK